MSLKDRPRPRIPPPAFCEDADEADNIIEGTVRCAASSVASPTKERPNTGKTRRGDRRRDSISPLTDSDSTEHPRDLRKSNKGRETPGPHHNLKKAMIPTQPMRPPAKHARTTPAMHNKRDMEASYYGVSPTITTAATSRRGHGGSGRPASYYGDPARDNPSRPPLANARYYSQQQPAPTPTSFPPPSWAASTQSPFPPPASPQPVVTHQSQDYFSRPLEHRFGTTPDRFPGARPQSSIGFRAPRTSGYNEYEDDQVYDTTIVRRPSAQPRLSKVDDDRRAMPPPMRRPSSARPTTLAFRPPPSTPAPVRRTAAYDEDDLRGDNGLFQDISPMQPHEYGSSLQRRGSRRPSIGATSLAYEVGDFRTEVAGRNRRHSYYGNKSGSSGSGYEDKLRQATNYQEETSGPEVRLTAETLRKAGRNGGSSRSTRSSGSHDESDYRQSATTRTTRSSNDEDVTIRVVGGATLEVAGAKMKCKDGAQINIASRGGADIRTVSGGRSSYMDYEDRRPRIERPPTRNRASSRPGGSFGSSLPKYNYDASYNAPLEYAPYYSDIPPYPSYPQPEGFF